MDQGVQLKRTDRIRAVERLRDFIVRAVDGARAVEAPFYHLQLEQVFPDDVYASMLAAMPEASDYRPLKGQNQCNVLADGTHTRVKIDLFPEYIPICRRGSVWSGTSSAARCARNPSKPRSYASLPPRWRAGSGRTTPEWACIRSRSSPETCPATRSIRTLIRAGRELPCNSFCRATRRILTLARSSTKSCPMAVCQNESR